MSMSREIAGMLAAAALTAAAGSANAGAMVFRIDVTSATGVSGFTPFSFQETFTLLPGSFSSLSSTLPFPPYMTSTSSDYTGAFSDTGSPVTASLQSLVDLSGAKNFATFDFGTFVVGSNNNAQGDFFQNIFGAGGGYQQSISAYSNAYSAASVDEAGLAAFFAATGPVAWSEQAVDAGFSPLARYSGTATLISPTPGVPEPATWGLMLLGFGAIGAFVRGRRSRAETGSAIRAVG